MNDFQFIRAKVENEIGWLTLYRPKNLNALNRRMVAEIVRALQTFDHTKDVKVIIIHGEGKAFAAGADIKEMLNDDPVSLEWNNQFAVWDQINLIKKPMIAAVHGFALGGGFELALACDLIYATETTVFGFPEVNLGVMPGAGGTQRLTKAMGKAKAMEWLLLGEQMTAKEALHYGVINHVVQEEILLEEVEKFAQKLLKKSPLSLRLIKESVLKAIDAPLDEGMQLERKNFYLLFSSDDQKEGMTAFIEKRTPTFRGK